MNGIHPSGSRGTYKSHRGEDSEDSGELHFDGWLVLLVIIVVVVVVVVVVWY